MRSIFLANYASNAVKGLIGGSDRKAAVEALVSSVGGSLVSLSFTRGEFDIAVVVDMPDQSTGLGLAMAIRASGAFDRISILEELDMGPILAAAKTASVVYKPAG